MIIRLQAEVLTSPYPKLKVIPYTCLIHLLLTTTFYIFQNKVQQLSKEIEEQKAKIERASKLVVKYARDVRSAQKVKGETHEEVSNVYLQLFCLALFSNSCEMSISFKKSNLE